MKKLISFLALSFCALTVKAQATHNMKITFQDGNTVVYGMENVKTVEFIEKDEPAAKETYTISGIEYPMPEAIDLGLPSGTKWANMNIGAKSIDDIGLDFAWAETEPKDTFTCENYKYYYRSTTATTGIQPNGSNYWYFPSKYRGNMETLLMEDDAAYIHLGEEWSIPSLEQAKELFDCLTWTAEWKDNSPVRLIGSAANGNSIIFNIELIFPHDELLIFRCWTNYANNGSATCFATDICWDENNNRYIPAPCFNGVSYHTNCGIRAVKK